MKRITDVYEPEAFRARVDFAAAVISRGGQATRRFDTCFEIFDGNEVAAALVYRARKSPAGKLAANLFRYISRDIAESDAADLAGKNLDASARESRAEGNRRHFPSSSAGAPANV